MTEVYLKRLLKINQSQKTTTVLFENSSEIFRVCLFIYFFFEGKIKNFNKNMNFKSLKEAKCHNHLNIINTFTTNKRSTDSLLRNNQLPLITAGHNGAFALAGSFFVISLFVLLFYLKAIA